MVINNMDKVTLLSDIEETFKTLEKAKMKLNLDKYTFGVEEGRSWGSTSPSIEST